MGFTGVGVNYRDLHGSFIQPLDQFRELLCRTGKCFMAVGILVAGFQHPVKRVVQVFRMVCPQGQGLRYDAVQHHGPYPAGE